MPAPLDDIRPDVLKLLETFQGPDPMKELFWRHLNYDRINKPLSRRNWAAAPAEALADDPTLLAAGGEGGDFKVLYARLAKDRLSLADERIVTNRILKDHPYSLFLFSDRTQSHWHFVNVKYAEEQEKRKLFRRVTVGPNEKMRTACQVVSQLDLASISEDLSGLSPLLIQQQHDKAFDVEPVTNAFYARYREVFAKVESLIKGIRDSERKRLFTQRLFNRLMFIAFIQKKGWLSFGGAKNQDYLNALWEDYRKNGDKEMGFYYERLEQLFFHGLGAQDDVGIVKINRGGYLRDLIGSVPYLNGGLFEQDEDDKEGSIRVPDPAIKAILHDLFDDFNFTVTEATPLDVEVAVDPEMLGKVFEELVTGRHESGSYYTPKPIVSFMCREALKGYLESNLRKETPEAIARFVDEHQAAGLRDAEAVLEALRKVRVCDPACGSGAYLLGMLHELMDLRACLFSVKQVDPISFYDRKLEIIRRNIYGVDLDPFAVNIARLRLWLSLAVEYEGSVPEPLPNLKFEIEEGDSITSPGPTALQGFMREAVVNEFAQAKGAYIRAHGDEKKELELQITDLKKSIASWTQRRDSFSAFDWQIDFADVLQDGGFDVVVANPPYVRQELIRDIKPDLKRIFPAVYTGVSDLYVYFYARAVQILAPGGMLVFISSNKWFKANYGSSLRDYLAQNCQIMGITDFGELPVFKTAATFPMIFVAKKVSHPQVHSPVFTQVKSLGAPYPDIRFIVQSAGHTLPPSAITGSSWRLANMQVASVIDAMKKAGPSLREYVSANIFYGVKTGFNNAFVIDSATRSALIKEDPACKAILKPLAIGDDIRRWHIRDRSRFLIFTRRGIDITRYPSIKRHLNEWRKHLEPKPRSLPPGASWEGRKSGSYKWYEIQDDVAYFSHFAKPKIVYPIICKEPRFSYDPNGYYTNDKAFIIPTDDLYLVGILNSCPAWQYLKCVCSTLGDPENGGRLELRSIHVGTLPIPHATRDQKGQVIRLVEKCLRKHGEDCQEEEAALDEVVASLYGIRLLDLG